MEHNRIAEAIAASIRALDALEALRPDASLDEQLDASIDVIRTTQAFLQALTRNPDPGEEDVVPELEHRAIHDLVQLQEQTRPMLSDAMDVMVAVAVTPLEHVAPGISDADRKCCRAVLLDNGFLTEGELTTFPRESLRASARQRLARWEETGDARG